jgi:hypothetical protein
MRDERLLESKALRLERRRYLSQRHGHAAKAGLNDVRAGRRERDNDEHENCHARQPNDRPGFTLNVGGCR